MTHLFFRFFLAVALMGSALAQAQNPAGYGDWQLHLPTTHPLRVADAGNRLYVVTESAFYFLDKDLNTTQVLSSRDGLHDVGATTVAYDSVKHQTFVVYKNSNIDVISATGTVRNIGDVLRKSVQGVRTVYDLTLAGRRGYLATSFGLVVLDLDKLEVRDTYTGIGPGGADVEIYAAAVSAGNDSLFVATSRGLQLGRMSDNLLDFHSWTQPGGQPGNSRSLATSGRHVYAGANGSGVFVYQRGSNSWNLLPGAATGTVNRLKATRAGLLVATETSGLRRVDAPGTPETVAPAAAGDRILDFLRAADGSYYVANYTTGLQRVPPGPNPARDTYNANGPQSSLAYGVLADARSNTVDVFTGGYTDRYVATGNRSGFYEYADGQWKNYTRENFPALSDYPNLGDQVRGARAADGTLYIATFLDGLLQWKGPGNFKQFKAENTPELKLRDFVPGYTQVPDVAVAADGTLWVVNYHKQGPNVSGLLRYRPATDSWTALPAFTGSDALERIALDDFGQAWITAARKGGTGVYAVDSTGANAHFTTDTGSDDGIYDIAKDRQGAIWVATATGVAVLDDPGSALTGSSPPAFHKPIVRKGDGSGFPALFSESVKAVAVDGANRKWFGTDNGLWLFSASADEALLHFTTANSPLPSNHVVDVDVNNKTGEVWVATDAGVVSYRGTATVTEGGPDCTKVFPNPVRPDFTGTMGIAGVSNNAQVKITDVAGHLVYATTASGGLVSWNLTDVHGQRVRSGVYLVLTSDADGANTCVSKVAVLSK